MPEQQQQWIITPAVQPPEWFVQAVKRYTPDDTPGHYVAQLLWQRGIQDLQQLAGFLNPQVYQPASPFEFGEEMRWAVERLQLARDRGEKVAIWGDFDADGITATAVLWDGLGQFFPKNTQLFYYIPNRLTESHGLNCRGIDDLAKLGCHLIVSCDTGSTNISEIKYAQQLDIDVIITDHHTLPLERPSVTAIINPRYLPTDHQLFHLSGVAVAYKLVEALYQTLPNLPQQPLENLLDLVAIGLIADLVQLWGDCRYLAQLGIEQLQQNLKQPEGARRRPGVGRLLELCQKSGDRPTDISFGLGPRINAVSRIQGDASFCVELLTSRDVQRCNQFAQDTELANTRRKSLQKDVSQQVAQKLKKLDLSTTSVIVLEDAQWPVGVLGLVAGQVAQETGRPTILLSTEEAGGSQRPSGDARSPLASPLGRRLATASLTLSQSPTEEPLLKEGFPPQASGVGNPPAGLSHRAGVPPVEATGVDRGAGEQGSHALLLARGSARSVNQIDLYQLVKDQAHLLRRFGGHPFAAGLSLPVENIPLFTEAINQRLRQSIGSGLMSPVVQADLVVTVASLGKELFRELKLLEPCGIGNPVPKLLIQNCWFERIWHRNEQDWRGKKVQYIKTEFEIRDDSTESCFAGVWWGHYKDELPSERCDCLVELDYNAYKNRYEIRLLSVRNTLQSFINEGDSLPGDTRSHANALQSPLTPHILDHRKVRPEEHLTLALSDQALIIQECPTNWDILRAWFRRSLHLKQKLVLAWAEPQLVPPSQVWQQLVGIAKYLSRTGQTVTRLQLHQKLGISDQPLQLGFQAITLLNFKISFQDQVFKFSVSPVIKPTVLAADCLKAIEKFLAAVQEEQFQRQYFYNVPLSIIQSIAASNHF